MDEEKPKNCKECSHSDHEAWCLEPGDWRDRYYLPDNLISDSCPFGWGDQQYIPACEEVFGRGYDTAGNYHWHGTYTGIHVIKMKPIKECK